MHSQQQQAATDVCHSQAKLEILHKFIKFEKKKYKTKKNMKHETMKLQNISKD
jgi:hypothetical protein